MHNSNCTIFDVRLIVEEFDIAIDGVIVKPTIKIKSIKTMIVETNFIAFNLLIFIS